MTMPTTNAAHSPALTETRKHHSTSPALYAKQHVITVSCQTACHPSFTPNSTLSQLQDTSDWENKETKILHLDSNGKCSNCYILFQILQRNLASRWQLNIYYFHNSSFWSEFININHYNINHYNINFSRRNFFHYYDFDHYIDCPIRNAIKRFTRFWRCYVSNWSKSSQLLHYKIMNTAAMYLFEFFELHHFWRGIVRIQSKS